jgi:hypothetical protein
MVHRDDLVMTRQADHRDPLVEEASHAESA